MILPLTFDKKNLLLMVKFWLSYDIGKTLPSQTGNQNFVQFSEENILPGMAGKVFPYHLSQILPVNSTLAELPDRLMPNLTGKLWLY